jgi:hypothetical protein
MIASLSSYSKVPDEEPFGTEASGAEKKEELLSVARSLVRLAA